MPVAVAYFAVHTGGPPTDTGAPLRQAREAAAHLGRFIGDLRDALAATAEAPAIRSGEPAGCAAMLEHLQARFGDRIVLSADAADGRPMCAEAADTERPVRDDERTPQLVPLQVRGFAVGGWDPADGRHPGGLHLGLPIPAEDGTGFIGTLTATVEPARLAEELAPVPLPPRAELILADRQDRVVLRLGDGDADGRRPGDPVPRSLVALLPAQLAAGAEADAASGSLVSATDERGAPRLVALAPHVPGTEGGLRLAVSYDPSLLPAGRLATPGRFDSAPATFVGLGALGLALLIAALGPRAMLRRPLAEALAAAARTSAGRRTDTPAPRPDPAPADPPVAAAEAVPGTGTPREREALLALALHAGDLGAWTLDAATSELDRSPAFDALFGCRQPVSRWTWRRFRRLVVPEDRGPAKDAFRRLRAGPAAITHDVRLCPNGDGALRTLRVRALHQRAPDGRARIFGVLGRASEATAAAPDTRPASGTVAASAPPARHPEAGVLRMSPAELSHRVRGVLATVQAIAAEALRAPPGTGGLVSAAASKAAFETRLAAVARAHEVLMQEDGAKADLSELANLVLAPHAAGPAGVRHAAAGPAVWLPARTALPLSLALNELAINAVRHGALAVPEGSVAVTWRLEELGPGQAPMLRVRWEERGGPRLEGTPRRRGFGLRLLESGLARELGGLISLEFRPGGLVCEIEAPLKAAPPVVPPSPPLLRREAEPASQRAVDAG